MALFIFWRFVCIIYASNIHDDLLSVTLNSYFFENFNVFCHSIVRFSFLSKSKTSESCAGMLQRALNKRKITHFTRLLYIKFVPVSFKSFAETIFYQFISIANGSDASFTNAIRRCQQHHSIFKQFLIVHTQCALHTHAEVNAYVLLLCACDFVHQKVDLVFVKHCC